MALVRWRTNRRGIRDLLGSAGVLTDLLGRGEAVATVARAAYEADPPHSGEVTVDVVGQAGETGARVRSRVSVIARHPAALHIEADRRPLGSALDAARLPGGG